MTLTWDQPMCDACWERRNPGYEPSRREPPFLERCCYCGAGTTSGIYARTDPRKVRYPSATGRRRRRVRTTDNEKGSE